MADTCRRCRNHGGRHGFPLEARSAAHGLLRLAGCKKLSSGPLPLPRFGARLLRVEEPLVMGKRACLPACPLDLPAAHGRASAFVLSCTLSCNLQATVNHTELCTTHAAAANCNHSSASCTS